MLLLCSMVYSTVVGTTKTLVVILDLTKIYEVAKASAGITFQRPVLELISEDYDNDAGPKIVIEPDIRNNIYKIKQVLYIWYYVCAEEAQCEITFSPSPFSNKNNYLGYTLTSIEPPIPGFNYEGTVPQFSDHIVHANGSNDASLIGEIITSNDLGVSRGYISYELEVDVPSGISEEYSSTWTVQITAI